MKEKKTIIEDGDLRIELFRMSESAFFEFGPCQFINPPFLLQSYWERQIEMGSFYWAMHQIFGPSARSLKDTSTYSFTFHFRLHVRKKEVTSIYALRISFLDYEYDVDFYKLVDETWPKKDLNYSRGPYDDFTERDMAYCINYIGGMCQGYAEVAPKPEFYFCTIPNYNVVWGCKDGAYFEEHFYSDESPPNDISDDEEKRNQWYAEQQKRDTQQYEARIAELKAVGNELRANDQPPDNVLDYPGYSKTEHALIRSGEMRCLMRQLNRRFGDEADQYRAILRNATSYQLACWAETVLDAKTLEDVFIAPSLEE